MSKAAFDAAVEAHLAWLATFVTELDAIAVAGTLSEVQATSSTSNSIGAGAKSFTVSAGKSFVNGMWLVIADAAAPSTNTMVGQVTSYSGTSLVMDIKTTTGSGTKNAWVISQCAPLATSSGLVLLAVSEVASAVASVAFTSLIDSTYDEYEIHFEKVIGTAETALRLQFSVDAGANWLATNYKYMTAYQSSAATTSNTVAGATSSTSIVIAEAGVNTAAFSSAGMSGVMKLFAPSKTGCKTVTGHVTHTTSTSNNHIVNVTFSGGQFGNTAAVNGVRFSFISGNVDSGIFKLYGVRKSV